jgi:hypothetical protein
MSLPPRTQLQLATSCAAACLTDAREILDEATFSAFVAILIELAQREAARLALGEALRAAREGT